MGENLHPNTNSHSSRPSRCLRLLAMMASFTIVAVPAANAQQIPKLVVGAVIPMTGSLAPFGLEARQGMELALDDFRARNEAFGAKVEILFEDNASLPSQAEAAAKKLLEKSHAHILIGAVTAAATTSVAAVADTARRPLIAPVSPPTGAVRSREWVWSMALGDREQGVAVAKFAAQSRNWRRALIVQANGKPLAAFASGFETGFAALGGVVMANLTLEASLNAQAKQLENWLAQNADPGTAPDMILLAATATPAAKLIRLLRERGVKTPIVGSDTWDTPGFVAQFGKSRIGDTMLVSAYSAAAGEHATTAFATSFRQRFQRDPGSVAAHFHDAMVILLNAFVRGRMTLPQPLAKALRESIDIAGAAGVWSLTGGESPIRSAYVMSIIGGGTVKLESRISTSP